MTLVGWIILLAVLGAFLIAAELGLPTHGILGAMGALCMLMAATMCFWIDRWLGAGVVVAGLVLTPIVGAWMVKAWPRTRVGRRICLQEAQPAPPPPLAAGIGQRGVAISELRPVGTCEFAGQRLEALSEHGIIEPGKAVQVVGLNNRRPVVREA